MANNTKPETSSGQSWMYSSLLQILHPLEVLSTKLGTYTGLYNFLSSYKYIEDHEGFKAIWKGTNEDDIDAVFISLHIITRSDDDARISQIGVSKWFPRQGTQLYSLQVQVNDDMLVEKSSLPQLVASGFLFGETEVIPESDIGPWLYYTFKALRGSQQAVYLVGHDVRHILHQVRPYWRIPNDIVILDTRALPKFESQETGHPSLKQILGPIDHRWHETLLDNAGNCAQLIIELLKLQASRVEGKKSIGIYLHMGLNAWRSPSW